MVERIAIGTATTKWKLTNNDTWTVVGVSPLLVMANNQIVYAFSDTIPEGTVEGFVVQRGELVYLPLTKTSGPGYYVWIAPRGEAAEVFVAGEPV